MNVTITADAQAKFDKLPKSIKARIIEIFHRLEKWPDVSGTKALRGNLWGLYRVRTGDYRVVFAVRSSVVRVVNIDNRRDVYEE